MLERGSAGLKKLYNWVLFFFSAGILTLFVIYKTIATSVLIPWEHVIYIQNSLLPCLLCLFLFLFGGLFIFMGRSYQRILDRLNDDIFFQKMKTTLLFVILLMSIGWAVCTQFVPGADEGAMLHYAYLGTQGNYEAFKPGNYLHCYPHQWGLFLLEYVMVFLFGGQNYFAFALMNSLAIVVIVNELSEIAKLNGSGRLCEIGIIVLSVLFIPLELYSIYDYGNIPSMAFALAAIKNQILHNKTLNTKYALLCAIEIAIAVWLKSTIEIYLIAILIYTAVDMIVNYQHGFRKKLLLIGLVILFCFIQSTATKVIIEMMTGIKNENPNSMFCWIAMALHESYLGPGWWDEYVQTSFIESGYNTQIHKQIVLADIREHLQHFAESPGYTLSFFTRKLISTWMNPTFQCFVMTRNDVFIYVPEWVRTVLSYEGQAHIIEYLNVLLFMMLIGALMDVVYLYVTDKFTENSILIMTFVGAVLFLMMWETKARYALMFVVTLFPYVVDGYIRVFEGSVHLIRRYRNRGMDLFKIPLKKRFAYPCILITTVVVLSLSVYLPVKEAFMTVDTGWYEIYLESLGEEDRIPDIVKTKYS